MKEESLGGYERASDLRDDMDDRPDACWAWYDRTLQCGPDGSWVARGVVEQDSRSPQRSSADGSPDVAEEDMEMVDWLEAIGLSFGASSSEWNEWVDLGREVLVAATNSKKTIPDATLPRLEPRITAQAYMDGIGKCRKAIFDGNSYELTLTTQFVAKAKGEPNEALKMYASLRKRNPAPYSSFMHFPVVGTTILSSSPERFIRIDADGKVEMKPIKGTRARVKCGCKETDRCPGGGGPRCFEACAKLDAEVGEALRVDGKERAENLMVCMQELRV
jgi:para-aminobenzoate synthetase